MSGFLKNFILASFLFSLFSWGGHPSRLINGTPVPDGMFNAVVHMTSAGASCGATVVGPRTVLTAAHCVKDQGVGSFEVKGIKYSAIFTRSPIYPQEDHDVAIGVTAKTIEGVTPLSIGTIREVGQKVLILGYGCTQPGGGGSDGVLRMGESVIKRISNYDFVSRSPGGAAMCFGDSGGPTLVWSEGDYRMVGINSKGNIVDTSYSADLTMAQSHSFLDYYSAVYEVEICGVNISCDGPNPGHFEFKQGVFVFELMEGERLMVELSELLKQKGIHPKWFLGPDVPEWIKLRKEWLFGVAPLDSVGIYTFPLVVSNETSSDSTLIQVQVREKDSGPSCRLTALPSTVKVGQSVVLSLSTKSEGVSSASIEGKAVDFPFGQIVLEAEYPGTFTVRGEVTSPQGVGECGARYLVVPQ